MSEFIDSSMASVEQSEREKRIVSLLEVDDVEEVLSLVREASMQEPGQEARFDLRTARDLETALAELEELARREGPKVVVTDLMFPAKIGSEDKSAGEKVIREICARFSIDADANIKIALEERQRMLDILSQTEPVYQPFKEQMVGLIGDSQLADVLLDPSNDYSRKKIEIEYWSKGNLSLEELSALVKRFKSDDTLRQQCNSIQYECYDTLAKKLKKQEVDSFYPTRIMEDIKNGRFRRHVEQNRKLAPILSKDSQKFQEGIIDAMSMIYATGEDLQPLGFEVANRAHELGIPVVMVTSHHAVGQEFSRLVRACLVERGAINDKESTDRHSEDEPNADFFMYRKRVSDSPQVDSEKNQILSNWKIVLNRAYEKAVEQEGR